MTAAKRIPDLTAIAGASTANDDNLVIFDTDANETKRILRSQLAAGMVGDLPYTPSGGISATTVPTAIAELDSEAAKSAALAASSGSSLVGYIAADTNAAPTTVQTKLREWVSAADFSDIDPTGGTDSRDGLQAAIDYCVLNGYRELRVDAGTYLIDGTLEIRPPSGSGFVALTLSGAQGAFLGVTKFVHAAGQQLNPLLAIQSVRDVVVRSIRFIGNNTAPSGAGVGDGAWRNPDPTAYVTSGCSAGRYNPYAGIAIDPLQGSAPANPADRYTFGSYGQGTSSKIKIENCRVENFVVAAICNAATGSENYVFDRMQFVENKFAICTTGSQQRNIIADNCDFNGHWVIFDNVTFNSQNGPPVAIQDGILAKAYRIFQAKMDVGVLSMRGGYCESVSSIGMIGTTSSSAAVCAQFDGVNFSLIGYDATGTQLNKDIALLINAPVTFSGCAFTAQFMQQIVGNNPARFDSCTFRADGASISSAESESFRVVTPVSNEGRIILDNCYQRAYSGATKLLNNTQFVSSLPGRGLLGKNVSEIVNSVTGKRYVIQPPTTGTSRSVTGVTNVTYVDADTLTFDFTVDVTRPMVIGDVLVWRCLTPAVEGATPATFFAPALRVTNIVSTTATCKIFSVVDTTYTPTSVDVEVPWFVKATTSTGNTTSGSADILSVTDISNFRVGDWLSFSNSSLPGQVRITNISGTTVTCHRTLNVTITGVQIYNTKLIELNSILQRVLSGTGSPETVVNADVGTLFLRTDGGASTTLYVKESGTGNTGWVAK